jgi:hypothetical protein
MMNLAIPQVRFLHFESHSQEQHQRDEDDGLWWCSTTQTDTKDIQYPSLGYGIWSKLLFWSWLCRKF